MKRLYSFGVLFLSCMLLPVTASEDYPFVETSRQSGISFQHQNSPTSQKYMIEILGGGAALFDYDGDGWLDVFLINGAQIEDPMPAGQDARKVQPRFWNRLYRNLRNGAFEDVTEKAGIQGMGYEMGVAVGDYDNDGDPDLYVTSFKDNLFFRNNGNGTFTDVTEISGTADIQWSSSAAFFDYDNDGWLDLYVVNYLDYTFEKNLHCGERRPGFRSYCGPTNYSGVADRLFHNNGDGTFADVGTGAGVANSEGKGLGVVTGDYNLDGYQDIYVANDSVMNFLYQGGPEGKFEELGLMSSVAYSGRGAAEAGMGTDMGDYDGDGWPDLAVTNLSFEGTTLYQNGGEGFFSDVSLQAGLQDSSLMVGFGLGFLDFDNDGDLDLLSVNGHIIDNVQLYHDVLSFRQPKQLYENLGTRFSYLGERAGPVFTTPNVGRGAAFGDLNNDGTVDVVIGNCGEAAQVLLNRAGAEKNWLMVSLVGKSSNRDGVGARLNLHVGGKVLHRQKKGGGSYLSAHDGRVHFGLGTSSRVDRLEVVWPTGKRQVLENLEANRVITIIEEQ